MQRYLFSAYMTSKEISFYRTFSNVLKCNVTLFLCTWRHFPRTWLHFPRIIFRYFFQKQIIFVTESIFFKFDYFPKFSFSAQNVFLLWILQHVIASQSNHINTMLPNEMVLAPLQKLKIKYELSYQSTTRLKYIDTFDQLLIIHQWTSTVDNTVRSLIHLTIFYLILCSKTFPIINKNHH